MLSVIRETLQERLGETFLIRPDLNLRLDAPEAWRSLVVKKYGSTRICILELNNGGVDVWREYTYKGPLMKLLWVDLSDPRAIEQLVGLAREWL